MVPLTPVNKPLFGGIKSRLLLDFLDWMSAEAFLDLTLIEMSHPPMTPNCQL